MEQKQNFKSTRLACYRGYIVQGIVNNLSPLFFVIFQKEFGILLWDDFFLILFNFVTQIIVDILCVKFVDRIGYRITAVAAHVCGAAGPAFPGNPSQNPAVLPFWVWRLPQ